MTGAHVKKIRAQMKLTQKEFSKLLGLHSYHWLSAIENDRVKISGPIEKIIEMLEKDLLTK